MNRMYRAPFLQSLSSKKILPLILLLPFFFSCRNESLRQEVESPETPVTIDLVPVEFGGNRYVIEADFGLEKKVPLMVHGNARFYMMLTHDIAEQLNHGIAIEKIKDYGYSDKGMGRFDVDQFRILDHVFEGASDIPVFDWPEEEGKAAQGMLGTLFLINENVRIDFAREKMLIGVAKNPSPDKALLQQGYSFTRFFVKNSEVYMNVYFEALDKELPVTIGTVADKYTLDIASFEGFVDFEALDLKGSSPDRTTPDIFTNSTSLEYKIANVSFSIESRMVHFYSMAEYENIPQSELFPYGIFGRDWMKQQEAIIDYANCILYFRSPSEYTENSKSNRKNGE